MIFVTVGTQLPFDRLVRAVDAWAGKAGRKDVIAQVGPTPERFEHVDARKFMSPQECRGLMQEASVIIAHAGMGSIIGALEMGRPILIMPRRASLGEHRNEHQLATARRFAEMGTVAVAMDEAELVKRLETIDGLSAGAKISPFASDRLIGAVRAFINGEPVPAASGLGKAAG